MSADLADSLNSAVASLPPQDIIRHVLEEVGDRAIVTTNFRPYEAVILHLAPCDSHFVNPGHIPTRYGARDELVDEHPQLRVPNGHVAYLAAKGAEKHECGLPARVTTDRGLAFDTASQI